jgi:class 3 adenylate cyclase
VSDLGHRRKLLEAIAALRDEANSPTPLSDAPPETDKDGKAAERRQVTLMFSDLVGSTALSARIDREDLREVISACQKIRSASRILCSAAGRGDRVLVYFGYPQAHGDDAERPVRVSLELINTR